MSENNTYNLVKKDYMSGMTYKAISEKYNVSINTVKSWKTRHNWSREEKKVAHTEKGCTQNKKKGAPKEKKVAPKKTQSKKQEIESEEITDKQDLFCCYYIRCFNATKAYMKAYEVGYNVAASAGSRLLKNKAIQSRIKELKQNKLNQNMLSESDIFQKYMDIAFSDISDYVEIKGNCIRFKNSENFDGAAIKKVTTGKTRSIELQDQTKALQWLADHMDLATAEQKARIEKLRAEIKKVTGNENEEELTKVDELLLQIKKQAGDADDTES